MPPLKPHSSSLITFFHIQDSNLRTGVFVSLWYQSNGEEHPIAIQFGGDDPKTLKEAAQMAQDWGYDEINFNVGCPSPRVCSGNFGASLMKDPEKVAKCIESLKNNCNLPVTIKHRIGVDNDDSFVS